MTYRDLVDESDVRPFALPLPGVVMLVLGIWLGVRKRRPPRLVLTSWRCSHGPGLIELLARGADAAEAGTLGR
jgi:hypothetical protein